MSRDPDQRVHRHRDDLRRTASPRSPRRSRRSPASPTSQVDLATGSLRFTSEQPSPTPPCRPPSKRPATSSHERADQGRRASSSGVAVVFGSRTPSGARSVPSVSRPRPPATTARRSRATAATDGGTPTATHEAADVPGGLMVSEDGYTLALQDSVAQAGRGRAISFVIEGPDGPVTAYDVEHEKRLHFIAVRRDFTGFQHVHPELADDGTWTTDLDLTPGQWRVFADFKPTGGEALTLGSDLSVPGRMDVAALAPDHAHGHGRRLHREPHRRPGRRRALDAEAAGVPRTASPVTDLQPYLGAYGHLVALRGGDLAYLHVHPDGEPGDGEDRAGSGDRVRRRGPQRRDATTSTSTSSTTEWCAPPSSSSTRQRPAADDHASDARVQHRAGHHRDDLRRPARTGSSAS